ncbi:unnamed protein product [Lampetra fluviatilis]
MCGQEEPLALPQRGELPASRVTWTGGNDQRTHAGTSSGRREARHAGRMHGVDKDRVRGERRLREPEARQWERWKSECDRVKEW